MPDLATAPPTSGLQPGPEPTPPSRRRRRVALGAVGLLVLALGFLWASPGLLVRVAPVGLGFASGAPATVVEGFHGPAGAYVVGYEHDQYLDVDVAVTNAGPVPVTIEEVALDLQPAPLLAPADATAPGSVPAGGDATAALRLRFDNCEAYHEREAMVVDHVLVTARVLGRSVTERVALDRPLMARSPMLWQCPDRTIERHDDRRGTGSAFRRDVP